MLLAQAAPVATDPLSSYGLKSLGIAGIFLALLIVVCRSVWKDVKTDRDAWKAAALEAQRDLIQNQMVLEKFASQGELTNRLLSELKATQAK